MSIITSIEPQKRGNKRVNIFLDGKFAFSLTQQLVEEMHLKEGEEISPLQIETYIRRDALNNCLAAAVRLLSYRPRSEAEMRSRLARLSYNRDYIEETIVHLKEMGLLDDVAFARYWIENRSSFSPRSRRLLRLELRQKGVDKETITEATESVSEAEDAYCAAQKKARTLSDSDYATFWRKLMSYLQRRGFSYSISKEAVNRLWYERSEGSDIPSITDSTSE